MPLFAFGVNHRSAPISVRERVSFSPERLGPALRALGTCAGIAEAAILSTCNRTDLYCRLGEDDGAAAVEWFQSYHRLAAHELQPHLYTHRSAGAVRHVMRVASGLDSLIIGEPQILGQMKEAYLTGVASGTVGPVLGKLFQRSFAVAKRVRTDTAIGSSPVSVAFAAVSLARQIFGDLAQHTALLVGAGDTIELAARHLRSQGLGRMIVANRTLENAHRLAVACDGYAIALGEIPAHLAEADIVLSSTASTEPILTLSAVRGALRQRRRRPMFMVDIAIPRDIDPLVGELEDVYLYTVDDLHGVIEVNLRSRAEAALQAEEIVDTQVSHFMGWLGTQEAVPTIRELRAQTEALRDEMLDKARRMLTRGARPEEALHLLAHGLTNKLLHAPTARLRQAGAEGRDDLIDAARELLALGRGEPGIDE